MTRRVLPDGCADVVVDLAGERPHAYVAGAMRRAVVVPPKRLARVLRIRGPVGFVRDADGATD